MVAAAVSCGRGCGGKSGAGGGRRARTWRRSGAGAAELEREDAEARRRGADRRARRQQQVLAKGWGYANLSTSSVQADNGAGLCRGIIGLVNKGQPRKPDDWGALRAWAWGASRALDYFETDKAVDAKQVGLEGHSR